MAKKSKTSEIPVPLVRIGTDSNISGRNNLVGMKFSLNLKKETFFGVANIWLTPTNYCFVVPDNLSDSDYAIIDNAIKSEILIDGVKYIPPVDKDKEVLNEYWMEFKKGLTNKSTKDRFVNLFRKGTDRNWTAYEIADYCAQQEIKSNKRPKELRFLKEIIDNYRGPIKVYEMPILPSEVQKVIYDPDQNIVTKIRGDGTKEVVGANNSEIIQTTEKDKKNFDSILGM